MKIVTYNVNGLRPRVTQYGSLRRLLDSLDADIICFQETKLSRQDLSVDLIMAEGYEAFVSCARTAGRGRSGYSGVATFCRVTSAFSSSEVSLPLAAEEGFTGLLNCSQNGEIGAGNSFLEMPIFDDITKKDLLKMEEEGRCLITDHGHFVLFNLYGPRAEEDNEERLRFKFIFYKILERRWKWLLNQGKRVFVVGDLNIAPSAMDRCDAEPGFERNKFRKWLRSILRESGGPFVDVFRWKHPDRKEAYTCFSQSAGAEEFNYGSRIDHILIAGSCLHLPYDSEGHNFVDCHVKDCDIMAQFKRGSDVNAPRWNGGRSLKLEGSDHIPVYAVFNDTPSLPLHNTPPISVRYFPEVHGQQQKIVSFLRKRQVSSLADHCSVSNDTAENNGRQSSGECYMSTEDWEGSVDMGSSPSSLDFSQRAPGYPSGIVRKTLYASGNVLQSSVMDNKRVSSKREAEQKSSQYSNASVKKKARQSGHSQLTIRSFFQQSKTLGTAAVGTDSAFALVNYKEETGELLSETKDVDDSDAKVETVGFNCEVGKPEISEKGKGYSAKAEWQQIQEKMKMSIPLCKGHREPCVARIVKREGPNMGRGFYVCARAKGPASNPEANCNHFQWATVKSKHNLRN